MTLRYLHRASALLVGGFLILHLGNHLWGVAFGPQAHDSARLALRALYGQPFAEVLLALAVLLQSGSGIILLRRAQIGKARGVRRAQLWAGLGLAVFLAIHVAVVAMTRLAGQPTDLGFASAGVQDPLWRVFFIPYYALAVLAVFVHAHIGLARLRRRAPVLWHGVAAGALVAALILGLMTGAFHEFEAPAFRLPGLTP